MRKMIAFLGFTAMAALTACIGLRPGEDAATEAERTPEPTQTAAPPQTDATSTPVGACYSVEDTADPGWFRCRTEAGSFEVRIPEGARIETASGGWGTLLSRLHLPYFSGGTDLVGKYLDVGILEPADTCPDSAVPGRPADGLPRDSSELVTVNGVEFIRETVGEGAPGHYYSSLSYSTSRDRTCVSLIFTLETSSALVPVPPHYAVEEWDAFADVISSFGWVESSSAGPLPTPTTVPTATAVPTPTPGGPVTIREIRMVDELNGWAIGGPPGPYLEELNDWGTGGSPGVYDRILRTRDGGHAWQEVGPPEPVGDVSEPPPVAFFLDTDRAWVIYGTWDGPGGSLVVWRTSDGGESWFASTPLPSRVMWPSQLQFTDESHGWLLVQFDVAAGTAPVELFRTSDGGATWQSIVDFSSPGGAQIHVSSSARSMVFADARTGVISIGSSAWGVPMLNWTNDGGVTWDLASIDPPADQPGLFDQGCGVFWPRLFTSTQWAIVVECSYGETEARYLYRTHDGGQTWQRSAYPGGTLLMLDPLIGFATGRDFIWSGLHEVFSFYRTEDGGQSWTLITNVPWEGQLSFVDDQNGWAVGRQRGVGYTLQRTRDGGQTWEELAPLLLP